MHGTALRSVRIFYTGLCRLIGCSILIACTLLLQVADKHPSLLILVDLVVYFVFSILLFGYCWYLDILRRDIILVYMYRPIIDFFR
jgi:hypothetical protein